MRKTQCVRSVLVVGFMSLVIVMAIVVSQGRVYALTAAEICAPWLQDPTAPDSGSDYDNDGFTDKQECLGLSAGTMAYINFPGWPAIPPPQPDPDRPLYLDPTTKDLFVILVRAATSNIPSDTLGYIIEPSTGLVIVTHEISSAEAPANRAITYTLNGGTQVAKQKAVRVTESLDPTGDILGLTSSWGTPNGLDLATIYTQRIINFIDTTCANAQTCTDKQGSLREDLYKKYIKHVIVHEMGHNVALTTAYNERFGGHHYKAGTTTPSGANVIMDQAIVFTNKGGIVTFYIGEAFTDADKQGTLLR